MTGDENSTDISHIVSNKVSLNSHNASLCVDKENGSGRDGVKAERSYSYLHAGDASRKTVRTRRKRGRKPKHWSLRNSYQRRHCPKRLRRREVENLLEADRFAARTGRRLMTFVTLRWALTQEGEAHIQRRWGALLNALRIWATRKGFELAHVWVHENPPRDEPAFNSHLLANVPPHLREKLNLWLMKQLGGLDGAVDVQPRTCIHWNKPDDRISYLCKGTDKATAMKYRLIRKHGWDFKQGDVLFRRCGTTRNINANSRAAFREQYARAGAAA